MAGRRRPHRLDVLAERLDATLERSSDALTERVRADLLDDTDDLGEPAFLVHFRAHWQDPRWRQQTLTRMGPAAFVAAANRAFGVPRPPSVERLARDGRAHQASAPAVPEAPPPSPLTRPEGY